MNRWIKNRTTPPTSHIAPVVDLPEKDSLSGPMRSEFVFGEPQYWTSKYDGANKFDTYNIWYIMNIRKHWVYKQESVLRISKKVLIIGKNLKKPRTFGENVHASWFSICWYSLINYDDIIQYPVVRYSNDILEYSTVMQFFTIGL